MRKTKKYLATLSLFMCVIFTIVMIDTIPLYAETTKVTNSSAYSTEAEAELEVANSLIGYAEENETEKIASAQSSQSSKVQQLNIDEILSNVSDSEIDELIYGIKKLSLTKQKRELNSIKENLKDMSDTIEEIGFAEDGFFSTTTENVQERVKKELKDVEKRIKAVKAKRLSYNPFERSGLSVSDINKLLSGSPMAGCGEAIKSIEQDYSVNAIFTIAVARKESSLGTSSFAQSNNNPFGMLTKSFGSFSQSIKYFGSLMNNSLYKNKTIRAIANTYCPPTAAAWASSVKDLMDEEWEDYTKSL